MEPEITPNEPLKQESPKASKFTIILILLIIISAGFLGYIVYKSNAESNTTSTAVDSATIADPVPSTNTPGSVTTPTSDIITPPPTTVPPVGSTPSTNPTPTGTSYTTAQVAEKNSKNSCWTIINGKVYDITAYVPNHPGGEAEILQICGKDGTQLFAKPMQHKEGGASDVLARFQVGTLTK